LSFGNGYFLLNNFLLSVIPSEARDLRFFFSPAVADERNGRFPSLGRKQLNGAAEPQVPPLHYPGFPVMLVALAKLMQLSLRKAAHAEVSSAGWQEIRVRSGRDDRGKGNGSIGSNCLRRNFSSP
jgi:hypothetical protein